MNSLSPGAALLVAAMTTGCFRSQTAPDAMPARGGSLTATDAFVPSVLDASATAIAEPNCQGFGGKIHGESECFRYDPAADKLWRTSSRIDPQHVSGTLGCDPGQVLRVGSHEIRLECSTTKDQESPSNKTVSLVLVLSDVAVVPAFPKRRLQLSRHTGYWDSINVWVLDENGEVDLTLDYITYD